MPLLRRVVLPVRARLWPGSVVELPRDPSHGDMATNAAMVLAKDAGQPPRKLADAIVEQVARG